MKVVGSVDVGADVGGHGQFGVGTGVGLVGLKRYHGHADEARNGRNPRASQG